MSEVSTVFLKPVLVKIWSFTPPQSLGFGDLGNNSMAPTQSELAMLLRLASNIKSRDLSIPVHLA
jgi:hypothetical protein